MNKSHFGAPIFPNHLSRMIWKKKEHQNPIDLQATFIHIIYPLVYAPSLRMFSVQLHTPASLTGYDRDGRAMGLRGGNGERAGYVRIGEMGRVDVGVVGQGGRGRGTKKVGLIVILITATLVVVTVTVVMFMVCDEDGGRG